MYFCGFSPPQELVTCCFGASTHMEKELWHLLFALFIIIVIIPIISILTGRPVLHTKQTTPHKAGSHSAFDPFIL